MKRRDFLALAGATALAAPLRAVAQQPQAAKAPGGRPWLIAFFTNETEEQSDYSSLGPFRRGLQALGHAEGRDFVIITRFGRGDAAVLPRLASDVVAIGPDLIVVNGDTLTPVHDLTTSVPLVGYFGGSSIRVIPTLVGSTARPVGNVTGIFADTVSLTGKHIDLAREIMPMAKRIGFLVSSLDADVNKRTKDIIDAAAAAASVAAARGGGTSFTPVVAEAAEASAVAAAYRSLTNLGAEIVVVGSGPFSNDRPLTVRAATEQRLPTIYNEQGYVEADGLISYGFDRQATFVRLATFADLILKGARVAEVPVEEVSSFLLAVNLKTAKSLGLIFPPTVLFRAEEVIQ